MFFQDRIPRFGGGLTMFWVLVTAMLLVSGGPWYFRSKDWI